MEKIKKLNGKEFVSYRICVGSVKMGEDLISHGCVPRKSLNLKYPEDLNDEYFGSFLCGYFDGDGCLSYTNKDTKNFCNYVSIMGTEEFLSVVDKKLNAIGIKTGNGVYKSKSSAFILRISNYSHSDFYNLIYNKSSYMLCRKFDKFRDMLNDRNKDFDISEVAKLANLIM